MNKLLLVATVPITLERFLIPFARHFRSRGWQVDAMAQHVSSCRDCVDAFDRVWDITWSRQPFDPGNLTHAPRQIREIVGREHYDLVHVHTPVAGFVVRYALRQVRRQRRVCVIYTAHGFHFYRGGPPVRNATIRALERLAAGWTDGLVVINEEDRQAARRLGLPPDRITYMPGIGVDPQAYDPASVSGDDVLRIRRELRLAPGAPLFLTVGELIPRKRQADLLGALARLPDTDAHLAIAGDGPEHASLVARAHGLGVADRVHFLGDRGDIATLNRAATAALLVSHQEGLPRCLLESLCLGVPVIGSDIRGTRDLLAGGAGVLTPVGDIEAIADAMTWMCDHPGPARAMAEQGRRKIVHGYTEAAVVAAHERLYEQTLAMNGGE